MEFFVDYGTFAASGFTAWAIGYAASYKILTFKRALEVSTS